MSNVLAKDRQNLIRDPVYVASEIEIDVIKLIGNEKVIPKSYRFTVAIPVAEHARGLRTELIHSEEFNDGSEDSLRHLREARGYCRDIAHDFQLMQECGVCSTMKPFIHAMKLIVEERDILLDKIKKANLRVKVVEVR